MPNEHDVLQWTPLPMLAHGKIIRSFTPIDQFPSLKLSAFYQNLYYGDEVFLFETNDANWARGYLIVHPLPSDFIGNHVDLDKLPEMKISVVIVPLSHVYIIDRVPMSSNFSPPSQSDFDNKYENSSIPSIYEIQQADSGEFIDASSNIKLKPPLPMIRLNSGDLLDEITPSLAQLSSHMYSFYSIGGFSLFEKLYSLFDELNNIRIKLQQNLLTKNEKKEAKLYTSLLLTKISKLLSSKGINRFSSQNGDSQQLKTDPSGFQTIAARDIHSGELYDYWEADLKTQPIPKLVAANQISSALTPNFPVSNDLEEQLHPLQISKFDIVTPLQILVDFKDVSGNSKLNPAGYNGMTAYLYLRTAKKRLTEAFAIHIKNSKDFSLDKISAALFRNIPGTEVDSNRIYLVAVITEEIKVGPSKAQSQTSIAKVRKGLAAGVTDISRIFSRHKGHLATGEAHQFIIKLFGSYVNKTDNTKLDSTNMNFGWGELVDRIIAGSNKGVAVNPRAEKLIVSIKEFKDDLVNVSNEFDTNVKTPIYQIRTNFFDPLVKSYDRIYLSLGKVNIIHNLSPFPGDLVSIQLINENPNSLIKISKGTNELLGTVWNFTSVRSNEVIGEQIKISNIERIEENEKLTLKLFVNYELKGLATLLITSKGLIYEYQKNQIITFINPTTKQPEGSIDVTSEYIGKNYNVESAFQQIFNWKRLFTLPEGEEKLIEALKHLNQATLPQIIKYFRDLLNKILKIINSSIKLNLENLKNAAFYSYIHLLDVVVARQEQYTYLFYNYIGDLKRLTQSDPIGVPLIGFEFLNITAGFFERADTEWRFVGRTICRILPLLIKISTLLVSTKHLPTFKNSWEKLNNSLISFLNLRIESMIPDQLLILEYTDLTLEHIRTIYSDAEVIDFAVGLISAVGKRGLMISTETNSLNKKESKIIITKLLLIRRLLNGFIFENEEASEKAVLFFYNSINWSIETYDNEKLDDIDILRLANSVLVSCCNLSWQIFINNKTNLFILPRNVSRLLLTISKLSIKIHQFARIHSLFEPKRNYSLIFPNMYPFDELITDSIINDVVMVEILVELGVIYSFISKIAKNISNSSSQGFISIIESCKEDDLFNSSDNFVTTFDKEDLFTIIQANRLLIQGKFFPSDKWISFYSLLIESATTVSELIKFVLIRDFIPSLSEFELFDRSLWSRYLKSILLIATSMPASICHLSDVPRKAAWKIAGDIRSRCANVINQSWDCLGWDSLKTDYVRFQVKRNSGYQAEFIQEDYGILEELSVFCLQRHSLCQIVGVKILWSIMISEILIQESLEEPISANKLVDVEKGFLLGLDKFFKSGRYKPGIYEQRNFIKRLKMVIRLDPEDEAFSDVYNFINGLSEFLDVQNDLSTVPNGEEFDDERTFHQLDILRQLARVNNANKFNSSLDDLFEVNLSKGNHVQAALCLELMASTYDWSIDEILPMSIKPKFPSENSFERKERLYKNIAEELVLGNKLEKAVLIYKELADAYDKINFDLDGLSFVHEKLSSLYLKLTSLDRQTPTYFKVSFIGLGFPTTVRSKSFIFEGLPFEHINSIHNRLLRLHTGAKIINDEEMVNALDNPPPGKYLNITIVKPQTNFTNYYGNLSRAARLYMQNKDLRFFTTEKRLQNSTSVLNLWVEETTFETYNIFPTLMNRSEILKTTTIKLSPIQNALKTLSSKTQDLVNAESSAQILMMKTNNYSTSSVFNELSRNLSGTVNSPINGGIGQYKEFFKLKANNEEEENEILLLQNSFDNLTICIYRCLLIHGKMVPSLLKDSHLAMINLFEKNFSEEIKRTGLNIHELEDSFVFDSSTPSTLSKVSTIATVTGTSANTTAPVATPINRGNSRIPSMASNFSTTSLNKVDTRGSDRSTSKHSQVTSGSGKKRFLPWRNSRLE